MADLAEEGTALMERIRPGDVAGLAELLQRYEPEVRLAARVLFGRPLRPHLDSVDRVQSISHRLVIGLRQNVPVDWGQQRLETVAADTHDGGNLLTSLPSHECDPARKAQSDDAVQHLCNQLDEKDRPLVELRLQGCSAAEVARRLGLDPDMLRVRLSRLRRRLCDGNLRQEWM